MKAFRTVTLAACVLGLLLPTAVQAGGGKKKDGDKQMGAKKILKTYDTNGNGVIDPGAESDALRKAFETDARLKYLDTNNDGKLDDSEIAAIKPKHKDGKKKNA